MLYLSRTKSSGILISH